MNKREIKVMVNLHNYLGFELKPLQSAGSHFQGKDDRLQWSYIGPAVLTFSAPIYDHWCIIILEEIMCSKHYS